MITRRDSWRWELDPRDPDYEPSPSAEGCDEEMPSELEALDDDLRNNGPKHYQPMWADL